MNGHGEYDDDPLGDLRRMQSAVPGEERHDFVPGVPRETPERPQGEGGEGGSWARVIEAEDHGPRVELTLADVAVSAAAFAAAVIVVMFVAPLALNVLLWLLK